MPANEGAPWSGWPRSLTSCRISFLDLDGEKLNVVSTERKNWSWKKGQGIEINGNQRGNSAIFSKSAWDDEFYFSFWHFFPRVTGFLWAD